MTESWGFVVRRDDMRQMDVLTETVPEAADLAPGQLAVAVEIFSLSANNVTYGALGDDFRYWQFYPAPEPWGRIPAWGYAHVVASTVPGIEVGARIFGYLPMSTHAVLATDGVQAGGFTDTSAHRRELPAVYNRFRIVGPQTDADRAARVAIFMPLYGTSWLCADMLHDHDYFGATRVLVSAASSKTALGVGHALQRDFAAPVHTVGLTSARNRAFTEGTGHWDEVVTYDEVESLADDVPSVYVDVVGNADLRRRVHSRLADSLTASVSLGIADWEASSSDLQDLGLPGPAPQLFFAPVRVEKRNADWGPAGLAKRLSTSQDAFAERSREWMHVRSGSGPDAIREALRSLMDGDIDPSVGIVVRP